MRQACETTAFSCSFSDRYYDKRSNCYRDMRELLSLLTISIRSTVNQVLVKEISPSVLTKS